MDSGKILVVDDDSGMTELLSDFCEMGGYAVKGLTDSREVLAMARLWRPDLITLDLDMPFKSGMDVLRELRADPVLAAIPVVVISCVTSKLGPARRDVQGVFPKPVNLTQFLSDVRQMLSREAVAV